MNENSKTLTYVGAALAVLLVAWFSRPSSPDNALAGIEGTPLFADFKDPKAAKSLQIVEYDDETAELRTFEVTQKKGRWVIPSHEDYPADASAHLAKAAGSMIDLVRLKVVSDDSSTHELYGVVEPNIKTLSVGATGVGKRVVMKDSAGKTLAQLVIGKEVKDQPGLRYVRIPSQAPVYTVEMRTDALTTDFGEWIEKDLLKLNGFDVKQVSIDDHSVDELRQALIPRSKMVVALEDSKWKPVQMQVFEQKKFRDLPLTEDEELDEQKLNDLKNALDDLKIVDVRHKPAGLGGDLKAGKEALEDQQWGRTLSERGFWMVETENGFEMYSNEGEVRCGMKDGVEYVLRFGAIAGRGQQGESSKAQPAGDNPDADPAEGDQTDDGGNVGANRFILVTAQFNQDLIDKPQLEPLPGDQAAQPAESQPQSQPQSQPSDQQQPGDDDAANDETPDDLQPGGGDGALAQAAGQQDQPATDDEPLDADAGSPAGQQDAPTQDTAQDAAQDTAGAEQPAKAESKPKTPAELKAQRDTIEKDNKRKQDDYEAEVKKGQQRVKELNERFADWYYIISNETYEKIHLSRRDIVRNKPDLDSKDDDLTLDPLRENPADQ